MLGFFLCLLFTIMCHELGHMLLALLTGVKVEAFSIGFGKPYIHKEYKGIDFRLTPWLIGGYCKLKGEITKEPNGFQAQKYSNKLLILIAGVTVNFIIAFVCYLLHYGSIPFGIMVDCMYLKSIFIGDIPTLGNIVLSVNHPILLQLSLINIFCAVSNLIPFPALDGGWLWMVWLEKPLGKYYLPFLGIVNTVSFCFLMWIQLVLIIWMFIK